MHTETASGSVATTDFPSNPEITPSPRPIGECSDTATLGTGSPCPEVSGAAATGSPASNLAPSFSEPNMRQTALWLRGETLWVFWTRVGDAPERILLSTIDLRADWSEWKESEPTEVLRPQRNYEDANEPLSPSLRSSVDHCVNQLRAPAIFIEDDNVYLVYAVAGESGLAIARIQDRPPSDRAASLRTA